MHIGHIELFVSDPAQAQQFYEETLGFEVTAVQGDGQFIWLKLERYRTFTPSNARIPICLCL